MHCGRPWTHHNVSTCYLTSIYSLFYTIYNTIYPNMLCTNLFPKKNKTTINWKWFKDNNNLISDLITFLKALQAKRICVWQIVFFVVTNFLAINLIALGSLFISPFPLMWSHIFKENASVGCPHEKLRSSLPVPNILFCYRLLSGVVYWIGWVKSEETICSLNKQVACGSTMCSYDSLAPPRHACHELGHALLRDDIPFFN